MRVSSNRRPRGGRANAGGNRAGSGNNRRQNGGNRNYDSNGPDGKIRGTANQVYDKYMALGTDAQTSGDRVAAENFFQHAEHYFRIIAANTAPQREKQPSESSDNESAVSEEENAAPPQRKSRSRSNDDQPAQKDGQERVQDNPVVVDLSTAEQPTLELAGGDKPGNQAEASQDADTEAKPKRKVSRTRTLRRRTSSRNVSDNDVEEVNTPE